VGTALPDQPDGIYQFGGYSRPFRNTPQVPAAIQELTTSACEAF
jgi:hypothetical protein